MHANYRLLFASLSMKMKVIFAQKSEKHSVPKDATESSKITCSNDSYREFFP